MPGADVVGAGYRRSGDLAAGPRNIVRTYSAHRGASTLKSSAPCSGVSPFRRSFWQRSPYREDMRGGWDTALWIGFAHLDARFVPTRRPVFFYRQHVDSVFNTRRLVHHRGRLVGNKLGNLRRKMSDGVTVVVPLMPDNGPRDAAWAWVRRRYEVLHPEWQVIEGLVERGREWCKGEAIAAGLASAKHTTLVIADADCVVAPEALDEAVAKLRAEGVGWVMPHTMVHRMDEVSTRHTIALDPASELPPDVHGMRYQRKPYEGYAGGGLVVVDRSEYEVTGGIPRAFRGWGAEDECLGIILDTMLGTHVRLSHGLWHLWHPPARTRDVHKNRLNRSILKVFMSYAGDPDAMWDLIQHTSAGEDPLHFKHDTSRHGGIIMVALETHMHGKQLVKAGETFRATDTEARRHAARSRKIARPMNGSVLQAVAARNAAHAKRVPDAKAGGSLRVRERRSKRSSPLTGG
jgi:hypothetical protein